MMIFFCTTCNHNVTGNNPSHPPTNGAGVGGQGQVGAHHPIRPVRYHMWVKHLVSRDHQMRTMARYGRRYLGPPGRTYRDSILEDCNYVVVGINSLNLHEFAVWCTEFGMVTELITYHKDDCCVVTIQGVGVPHSPTGPGVDRAQNFEKQNMCQGRVIRVFRASTMTDADWNSVYYGSLKNDLYRENMRRHSGKRGNPSDAGQTKRALKAAASNHLPTARSDKENQNRGDKVDGPNLDQIGRVGKSGDRKANAPRVQVVKENVAEVEAVCKVEEPPLETSGVVLEEEKVDVDLKVTITTGGERGSSVRENQMGQRKGKKNRVRYDITHAGRIAKSPLPSTYGGKENCEVSQPNEAEHSEEVLKTVPEENKLTEHLVTVKDQSLVPTLLVVDGEAENIEVMEVDVKVESASVEEEKSDAEKEKADSEEVTINVEEQKADAEEKVGAEKEKADAEEVKLNVEEQKADAEKAKVSVEEHKADAEVKINADEQKDDAEKVQIFIKEDEVVAEELNVNVGTEAVRNEEEEKTCAAKLEINAVTGEVHGEEENTDADVDVIEINAEEEKTDSNELRVNVETEAVHCEEEKAGIDSVGVNDVTEDDHREVENADIQVQDNTAKVMGRKFHGERVYPGKEMAKAEKKRVDGEEENVVVQKDNAEVQKVHCVEEKVVQDVQVSAKVEMDYREEDKTDGLEVKAKTTEKNVSREQDKAKVEERNASDQGKMLNAGEEENADEDYMKYALYWYRF